MLSSPPRSEDREEDLAAHVGVAGFVVRHHTLRRGDDGDAETIGDARKGLDRRLDAPARLGDAGDLTDHRLAVEVLELDLELGAAR